MIAGLLILGLIIFVTFGYLHFSSQDAMVRELKKLNEKQK